MKRMSPNAFALAVTLAMIPVANAQETPPAIEEPSAQAAPPAVPPGDDVSGEQATAPSEPPADVVPEKPSAPAASSPAQAPPAPPATPASTTAARTSWLNDPHADHQVALHAEVGLLWPVAHTIQFGKSGSRIDYVAQGGQDNLFPFARLSADVSFFQRHVVTLLYQPLQLVTTQTAREQVRVFDTRYATGTPMRFTYGFDFWRLSYLYDFNDSSDTEIGIGASLQIRNATIITEAVDGSQANYLRNIGPVPVLKARARTDLGSAVWVGAEVDGFYAPIRFINGGTSDVEGAILDASVRGGVHLTPGVDTFLNLRYLGGGSSGTSTSSREPGDGFTDNWLHFVSLTLGFTLR